MFNKVTNSPSYLENQDDFNYFKLFDPAFGHTITPNQSSILIESEEDNEDKPSDCVCCGRDCNCLKEAAINIKSFLTTVFAELYNFVRIRLTRIF